jgi:hypothetical protein
MKIPGPKNPYLPVIRKSLLAAAIAMIVSACAVQMGSGGGMSGGMPGGSSGGQTGGEAGGS